MTGRRLRVVIEADGGARGNPGPAGYGAVVREAATGEVLAERAEALGTTTNNVAEYSGLIAGLTAAAELGAVEVEVRMDSKLVVEQMCGRWRIKHPGLRPLAAQAATLVRRFEAVTFDWIPRERNKHADRLANEAMDAAAGKTPRAGRAPSATPTADPGTREVASADSPARALAREVAARAGALRQDTIPGSAPAAASGATVSAGSTTASGSAPAGAARSAGPSSTAAPAPSGAGDDAAATAGGPRSWAPPLTPPTRLILVRHGETAWTSQRRYSGRDDVPLSQVGLAQARAAAARVAAIAAQTAAAADRTESGNPVTAVVSSPLSRCTRTAELVALAVGGLPVALDEDLVECDFGVWEGLTFGEASERWPDEMSSWLADPEVAPPRGESFREVAVRAGRALERLRNRRPGDIIVVVSHVSPIKLILRDALGANDALLHRLYLDAAGISVIDFWADGGVAVRTVNETAHLPSPPA